MKKLVTLFCFLAISSSNTLAAEDLNAAGLVAEKPDLSLTYLGLQPGEQYPGGQATQQRKIDRNSFSHASANLSFDKELNFKVGNGFFRRVWVSAPASTQAADGLGPLFNSRSCQRCHIKDGRGHPPLHAAKGSAQANGSATNEVSTKQHSESFLMRLSIPPQNAKDRALLNSGKALTIGDPVYGSQLQSFSVQGVKAEGNIGIAYRDYEVSAPSGASVTLQQPVYSVTDAAYGELHADVQLSPRIAPQMIGLGLLEAIDERDLLALTDEHDVNQDGISGRINWVWSNHKARRAMGRFGHKAGVASLNDQNQGAFVNDMGLSTPLIPRATGDCTAAQTDCLRAPDGNSAQYEGLEIHSQIADLVLFYTQNLAVPKRRNAADATVLAGKRLFHESGCAACHHPSYQTASDAEQTHLANQRIWPYTDLLLHDMGDGLADGAYEGRANGREWRTAPLWGIGLTEIVNGHTRFLHDGRARNLTEAILWHGGEAETSRNHFMALTDAEQQALLAFVGSL